MRQAVILTTVLLGVAAMTTVAQDEKPLAERLEELLPGMGAEKIGDRRNSQQEWQKICGGPNHLSRSWRRLRLSHWKKHPLLLSTP